jgi:hypothetical protein
MIWNLLKFGLTRSLLHKVSILYFDSSPPLVPSLQRGESSCSLVFQTIRSLTLTKSSELNQTNLLSEQIVLDNLEGIAQLLRGSCGIILKMQLPE